SFDFGKSWMTREQVSAIFLTRLPATLTITIPILLLEAALAIPTAMLVAYYRGTLLDRTVMAICVAAMSISFLVYIIVGQYVLGFLLGWLDRKSTRLNSSHVAISYAVFCLKKKRQRRPAPGR